MSFENNKGPVSASESKVDPHDATFHRQQGRIRLFESLRLGLTALSLLAGLTILGASSHALMVYNSTHLPVDYNLPLWPSEFDVRPAVALVVGSTIVVVANLTSFVFSKVRSLRSKTLVHTSVTFIAPLAGFVAALVAITFFYAVNASTMADTLQSWSCRWAPAASMRVQPYFGTVCRESRAALYLAVILVPLELVTLTAAGAQMTLERKAAARASNAYLQPGAPVKASSPALS
ncbi:hypothetical protein F5Y17DRAFT_302524 [Xylariaceae sp. FL0594]|nr:hypothetical protein F5Y17DRAFT_302524 [Xylariaceae sp. FL0594]